jgi:hypothetical protein
MITYAFIGSEQPVGLLDDREEALIECLGRMREVIETVIDAKKVKADMSTPHSNRAVAGIRFWFVISIHIQSCWENSTLNTVTPKT